MIPKSETIWERVFNQNGKLCFIITSNSVLRDWYFLYQVKGPSDILKIGKARSPLELKEKYNVEAKLK